MSTVVLDSHVVHWWSAESDRISTAASKAISDADELAVADISWFELAWLARHERIVVTIPLTSWLQHLGRQLRTIPVTPAIAATAVTLPSSFPGDPADRLIYATAVENGWRLITKDRRLRTHRHPRSVALW
ncbi:MAG: type II toxin-antitoxin system VapC family toxin [Chloroflexi bacterium]|nr:type II toxin-antitoxin system VapC family toxin [Chloroflexota bacterium]